MTSSSSLAARYSIVSRARKYAKRHRFLSFTKKDKKTIIEQTIQNISHYKISQLLNDLAVSKFVRKKWIEANDLLSGPYSVNKI